MSGERFRGRLGGEYVILKELDRGGFGVVYLATDETKKLRAIKVLSGITDEALRASYTQEVESIPTLDHPGIIKLIDFGESTEEDGTIRLFSVMEYCPDGNYRKVLTRRAQPSSIEEVTSEFRQILEALAVAHARVIHRDIKPENILRDGATLKLADFGLAKFVDQATRTLTFKGAGTPLYMAPETWQGGRISPATDLYSVGIMLFESLVGHPPFLGDTVDEVRSKHILAASPRIRIIRNDVPPVIDGVITRLLEKEPARRYQTANDVLEALASSPRSEDPEVAEIAERMRRQRDLDEAARLERMQVRQREADDQAKIRYKEEELIALFDDVVAEVNEHLQETAIYRSGGDGSRVYRAGNRSVHLKFFKAGALYERPIVSGRMQFLRDKHAVHGGFIEIRENDEDREGWNIVLVHPPENLYGDWIIVETELSPLVAARTMYSPIATEAQLFADNLSCHWGHIMHTYQLRSKELGRADIFKILKVLIPNR